MQIVEPRRRARRSGELHATCVFATMLVAAPDAKKPRTGEIVPSGGGGTLATSGPARTSELLAPIMLLTGHTGPVLTCKFSPDGQHVMTGSHDRLMLLWNTFGECENTLTLRGHRNAILELHWASDGEAVFSASADKTVAMWDAKTGARTRQFKGHTSHVNSCCPSADAHVVASGSDDCSARLWDDRVRVCQGSVAHQFPVTAVAMQQNGTQLYTGGLDGRVRVYDLRRPEEALLTLQGHQDIVTGVALSSDGNSLLSNSMDNTMRCWDVKPYASGDRCSGAFLGAQHNYEKGLLKCAWSKSGKLVAAGSADSFVYVWDAETRRIAYKLPGHGGSVNEVDFHPSQPIICSAGNDKNVYLGEIRAS